MRHKICGVILAGGLARRMGGGDKGLRDLAGRPILAHILERVRPQVTCLVVNANGDASRFAEFRLPVAPDAVEGNAGPLAGVLTGMEWAARHASVCDLILTVPSDAPFLPRDLVERLERAMIAEGADIACASSGGRTHPPIALWPVSLAEELREAMTREEIRKVDVWTARYKVAVAEWPTEPLDPFFNANKPEDLAAAEEMAAAAG
jgi:molybdopterin-guanine dinucleotide biosynthesis protein A